MKESPQRNLAMELVRVTEAAALAVRSDRLTPVALQDLFPVGPLSTSS